MSDYQKRRLNWASEEESLLKRVFKEKNIQKLLDGKKYRKNSVYAIVRNELVKQGYDRTIAQIKQKWQNIKRGTNHNNNNKGNTTTRVSDNSNCNDHSDATILLDIGMDTGSLKKSDDSIEDEIIDGDFAQVIPVSPSDFCPTAAVDKGKGRGSYGKALNAFHSNWVRSCNNLIRRQEFFAQKQADKQRQWEAEILEKQRRHDKELIEMSNAAFQTAVNALIAARKQPSIPYPIQQCKIYPSQSSNSTIIHTTDETKILCD